MSDDLDRLRRRLEAGRRLAEESDRRQDYKGPRGRLNLRVRESLLTDLELVKLAGGGDKNSVCEAILVEGVARKIAELQAGTDKVRWSVLREQAGAERGGDSD